MMSVGLAVSAVPEGLSLAISVALAIGMRRMAKANVIILRAVESLGYCSMTATDKTGTLTMTERVVTDIRLPVGTALSHEVGQDLDKTHSVGLEPVTKRCEFASRHCLEPPRCHSG
ncbi:hypothetical protein [Cupriavidus necator]